MKIAKREYNHSLINKGIKHNDIKSKEIEVTLDSISIVNKFNSQLSNTWLQVS